MQILRKRYKVAIASSLIFRIVDEHENANPEYTYLGKNGVAWVLRFGGVCTLVSGSSNCQNIY